MPRQFKPRRDLNLDRMFETRSEAWERVGLSVDVSRATLRRARREAVGLVLLLVGLRVADDHRVGILGKHPAHQLRTPLQIFVALALVAIGWALARDASRIAGPTFLR